jgi:signal transduction histidine kinase
VLKIGQDATERRLEEQRRRDDADRTRLALETRVAEATRELRALSRRLLTVQEDERRVLARELHDEIGQALTGLGLQLGDGISSDPSRLGEARQIVRDLTEQVRNLSMDLRPAVLDRYGLLAALQWHLERYGRQTGIRVELRHEGMDRRFPAPVEIAAYRIVQEALTNVARHSRATMAIVQCLADEEMLTVSVRDDGRGFDPTTVLRGSGLGGMHERAELLGGALTVDNAAGQGVVTTAELPLHQPEMEGSEA